jgi:hypothetical protein
MPREEREWFGLSACTEMPVIAPFRRLSDTLAQIPSPGPEDTALESDRDSAEGSTSSPASDEKAPGESGGWLLEEQEHGLWEEWSDHREGSAVKAAIVKWGTDDLDVSAQGRKHDICCFVASLGS